MLQASKSDKNSSKLLSMFIYILTMLLSIQLQQLVTLLLHFVLDNQSKRCPREAGNVKNVIT